MALQCKQSHTTLLKLSFPSPFPKPCPQAHSEMAMLFAGGET